MVPENVCILPLRQVAISICLSGAYFMHGIPIENFFFNWELFYLTHIHDNWANPLTQKLIIIGLADNTAGKKLSDSLTRL
jgi:hypothetical protein